MCNYVSLLSSSQELEEYFEASYQGLPYHMGYRINGFANPMLPIISDKDPKIITSAQWGLIPEWGRNRDFQKRTLNARIETLESVRSYRDSVNKRALVLVNAFFEWQWLDPSGKQKQPYSIQLENATLFALGALYSDWKDPLTNETTTTFSIVTTDANPLMAQIHNTKKRMPLVLDSKAAEQWLSEQEPREFAFPHYDPKLEAQKTEFE